MTDKLTPWEIKEQEREAAINATFRDKFNYQFKPRTSHGKKFGVEVSIGAGWYPIIQRMCEQIHELIKDEEDYENGFQWLQIKEKFGTLRAYYQIFPAILSPKHDAIVKIVTKGEQESEETCEQCGKPGKMTTYGWMMTLCEEHSKERFTEHQRVYALSKNV